MTNTRKMLLTSVAAAALIAGVGVVSAQAPPAPAAQQNAPAEKMGPALRETQASPDTRPDQKASEPKADIKKDKGAQAPAPATKSTTDQAPDSKSKATTGQAPAQDDKKSRGTSSETKSPGKTSSDMKADTKTKADTKADAKSSEKADDTKAATTGQGAAGTAATLSTEQRTTIRTVIKQQNVQPMTNVNFSISVGGRVPRTVNFHPVPVELVQIYPHWRGYDYILVGDQIIVVNPRTYEIVAVLDA
ncbi:DUF1236 domain-containing protein [Pseudorhodoplanes sinuspersici]|uniref:Uncharacterized protein n=1 Tax=Pseudorhodoplanes sinuspersici TaxID=1235591 RepID=A0A1W6ZS34_9HYPH|nr:DUF1236 domain-containing protein [Pseudorhodoplanes sinuspersici]ARQ00133.1 hypothetical protein CAK95_14365 [Pseudorhodoplanes sinuspersici]RKE65651.1 uncharacterized protein DUF1236 [Pseudorhodoplanes sinuspersici]